MAHTAATIARTEGIEWAMEGEAHIIQRREADPEERRQLVTLMSGLMEVEKAHYQQALAIKQMLGVARWLLDHDMRENSDHDAAYDCLREACRIFDNERAV